MLWASAQRAGVKYLLTEDFQDGFVLRGVTFVNPFNQENDQLIDELMLPNLEAARPSLHDPRVVSRHKRSASAYLPLQVFQA